MSENGEIYTAGKKFTLPPALTVWTNSTSEKIMWELMGPVLGKIMEQTLECCLRSTSRGRSLCLQNRAPEQFGVNWKMFFLKYLCCMCEYDIYSMKTEQAQTKIYIELSLWP